MANTMRLVLVTFMSLARLSLQDNTVETDADQSCHLQTGGTVRQAENREAINPRLKLALHALASGNHQAARKGDPDAKDDADDKKEDGKSDDKKTDDKTTDGKKEDGAKSADKKDDKKADDNKESDKKSDDAKEDGNKEDGKKEDDKKDGDKSNENKDDKSSDDKSDDKSSDDSGKSSDKDEATTAKPAGETPTEKPSGKGEKSATTNAPTEAPTSKKTLDDDFKSDGDGDGSATGDGEKGKEANGTGSTGDGESHGSSKDHYSIAPFGKEDTSRELQHHAARTQDTLVDAIENAEVAEIKRSIFRSLTRLRAAEIKEFDTIARLETQAIDEYNDNHQYRKENPLDYIGSSEPKVTEDKYTSFHGEGESDKKDA